LDMGLLNFVWVGIEFEILLWGSCCPHPLGSWDYRGGTSLLAEIL
jgi:hypothetical protein